MKVYKNNKTFGVGNETRLNACVGQNGFNDIEAYEFGYKEAVKIIIDHLKNDSSYVDPLIYPLVFSARHCLELFLKKTVRILEAINDICKSKTIKIKIKTTHDLQVLWNYFEDLARIDNRFDQCISDLDDYIKDYFEVDLSGETFRYPYNKDNDHHLDDYSCINILNFEKRFLENIELLERTTYHAEFILEEYVQETFVHGVCRENIEKISLDLPKRETWPDSGFKIVKKEIMKKYSIGSRALSDVINIIQTHKEFSCNIGVILPVNEIIKAEYIKLKEIFTDYHKNIRSQKDRYEYKNKMTDYIIESLSDKAICAIRTFWEIGFHGLYSEQYEPLVKHFIVKNDVYCIVFMELIDMRRSVERIEVGIKRCGQIHLLED